MGTRGALTFVHSGVEKTTYVHWDSYPSGLGEDVLSFLKSTDHSTLADRIDHLVGVDENSKPSAEDRERFKEFTDSYVSYGDDWYAVLHGTQGDPEKILRAGRYCDAEDFPADSLFCEWAYVIDADTQTFEVHEGFQSSPHTEGRFAAREFNASRQYTYYPVKLIASYSFDSLPDSVTHLEDDEEDV